MNSLKEVGVFETSAIGETLSVAELSDNRDAPAKGNGNWLINPFLEMLSGKRLVQYQIEHQHCECFLVFFQ